MKLRVILLILPALVIVTGCGGMLASKGEGEKGSARFSPENYPLNLPEDLAVIPALYPVQVNDSTKSLMPDKPPIINPRPDTTLAIVELYRVQIFTSRTYGPAVREQNIASEIFDKKVTLDYEVPYYKVRLGDFTKRREAEDYLSIAKDAGYDAAWVVRANLNVQSLAPAYRNTGSTDSYTAPATPLEVRPEDDSTANPGY
jgi:hypothetical protein